MTRASDTVSVVIPVYQGERFLAEAIASVRRQTLPAAEVIVVDDGSTDASVAVARAAAADWPALSVLALTGNSGPSAARNAGVARASGALLTFLDADDLMAPDRLEHQVRLLAERPEVDLVYGRELFELEEGVAPPDWLRGLPPGAPNPHILTMMVRRAAFDRVGGFDPSMRMAEDVDWFSRASAEGIGIAATDAVLLHRRLHGANATSGLSLEEMQRMVFPFLRRRMAQIREGAA